MSFWAKYQGFGKESGNGVGNQRYPENLENKDWSIASPYQVAEPRGFCGSPLRS